MYNIATFDDKKDIKALWAYAFDEQEPFLSRYFDEFWKAENSVIIKEDDVLKGALSLIPYSISLRGSIVKSSYIAGVSVCPEAMSIGYSKALMKAAIYEQRKRKEPLSLLIPFSYDFYRKFGYSLCYTLNVHETDSANIRSTPCSYELKKMELSDFLALNKSYEAFLKDKNGYILRTKEDWSYIFFEHSLFGGYIYGVFDGDELKGYISYTKSSGSFFVQEIVYNDKEALDTLISFITSHFSSKADIIIRSVDESQLFDAFKEPKNTMKVMPTVMARITDVSSVLEKFDTDNLKIKVRDSLICENDGIFYKTDEAIKKADSGEFDAEIDISALTQLVMGFKSAYELAFSKELIANIEVCEKLDRIFPKTVNYINHIMEA